MELLPSTVHPARHRSAHAVPGRAVGWARAIELTLWATPGCALGLFLAIVGAGLPDGVRLVLAVVVATLIGYALVLLRGRHTDGELRDHAVAALAVVPAQAVVAVVATVLLAVLPGALEASLRDSLSWSALVFSVAVAFLVAIPISRWLIGVGFGSMVPGRTTTGRRVRL
jgi:uncharacterized membrane protein